MWIRQRRKELKFWVQNRAETVRETVVVENWGFGFSSLNPADICTRECSVGKSKVVCCSGPVQNFCLAGKRCGYNKSSCCQKM